MRIASDPPEVRGTGTTTRQMLTAPPGAVFVWCSGDTWYPRALAQRLGREDLEIKPIHWLTPWSVMRRRPVILVVDHALRMNDMRWEAVRIARRRTDLQAGRRAAGSA